MKKIFVIVILLLAQFTFAQNVIVRNLGTVANSVDETGYIDLSDWNKIDSVSVTFVGKGEIDVDSLTVYKAAKVGNTFVKDLTPIGNFTVTLDLNDGVYDLEPLFSSGATLLTGAALRGCNAIYYLTRGATSGNDPTDPNNGWILFHVWGTKK